MKGHQDFYIISNLQFKIINEQITAEIRKIYGINGKSEWNIFFLSPR